MVKDLACLINCARGPVVDERELVKMLEESSYCRGRSGIDMYEKEPRLRTTQCCRWG